MVEDPIDYAPQPQPNKRKWVAKMVDGEFKLIPVDDYLPENWKTSFQVLQDTIPDTWHPVTGQMCSSRTGMVKIAKAHGLEELGNEKIKTKKAGVQKDPERIERLKAVYDKYTR